MKKADETSGKILFEEKEKFPKWILVLVLVATSFSVVMAIVGSLAEGFDTPKGRLDMWVSLGITIPVQLFLIYVFYNARLEKVVTSNGIYFRWTPLQKKYRVVDEDLVERAEPRKAPIAYGAKRVPGYGKVHSVSKQGVQLYLLSGKKMFFGSGEQALFQKAVSEMLNSNSKIRLREF